MEEEATMKMSEGVEWALHCLLVIAALPVGAALSAKALAEFHGVSEPYLSKHLKALAKAGVLVSSPGPKGGYRLGREPEDITLLEAVLAVEGGQPAFRCSEIRQRGPAALGPSAYRAPCLIHVTMSEAENAWRESLASVTISQLAERLQATIDPRSVRRMKSWLAENQRD